MPRRKISLRRFQFSVDFNRCLCGTAALDCSDLLRVPSCPLWLKLLPFRSRRCRAMTSISAIDPPPLPLYPIRSQSSQFGVGFRIKTSAMLVWNSRPRLFGFPPCSFVSFVVTGFRFGFSITRLPNYSFTKSDRGSPLSPIPFIPIWRGFEHLEPSAIWIPGIPLPFSAPP